MVGIIPFLSSVLPIVILIWLMAKKNGLPSHVALPLIAFLIFIIQIFYWGNTKSYIFASVLASVVSTLVPVSIIFGAILFNKFNEESGAIVIIKRWLANITPNPTAQLMIIGWAFAFMIEGASGFGTPAAIAAPLLVSLGFKPIPVCILTLVMNSVPVSFGAVGTPTWYGFSQLNHALTVEGNSFDLIVGQKTALIHLFASLVIPLIALRFCVSTKEIAKNLVFIYLSILSCVVPYYLIALFNNEFPALVGGAIGLLLSVLIAKFGIGVSKTFNTDEIQMDTAHVLTYKAESKKNVLKALFPFGLLIVILILTRLKQLPFKEWLTNNDVLYRAHNSIFDFELTKSLIFKFTHILGTVGNSLTDLGVHDEYKFLFVPAFIPFVVTVLFCSLLFRLNPKKVSFVFTSSMSAIKLTFVALFGAFVMVKLMTLSSPDNSASMVITIGDRFSAFFGKSWVYFASYLGAIGAFFSGSNTVSNLTFGSIQQQISIKTAVNQTTMLALQSTGSAMGNMVCLNNIIAVCTITGVKNQEGYILKRTAIPMFVYGIVCGLCAFIFMHLWNSWSFNDYVAPVVHATKTVYVYISSLFA